MAAARRRQHVAEQQDVELDEEDLVPRGGRLEGLARITQLGLEDAGQRGLRQAHRADHELRRDLAAGAVLAMAVRERDAEEVVDEALVDGDLGRLLEPAPQAVLAALDALAVGLSLLTKEELRRGGELEEVLVERGGERRLVLEHERRGAADQSDVLGAQADEGHLLPDEALHVRARMNALDLAHGFRA